jgi:hypothetical protein
MKIKRNILLIFIYQIVFIGYIYSQERINDYDESCYCSIGISHPSSILDLDNNREILFSLKNGKTLNELDSLHISFNKSQIVLLETSSLIERRGLKYYSLVPILGKQKTTKLRTQTQQYAKELIPMFEKEYMKFSQLLKIQGFERNTFTIFFSYILDEIVWQKFEERIITKETEISKIHPYWDGVLWLIYPKRSFNCGTNSFHTDKSQLCVNWSDNAKIDFSSYNLLGEMLDEYNNQGIISNENIIKEFKENGIFDDNFKLRIPIIHSNNTDKIYLHSQKIANIIVEYIDKKIDYSKIQADYALKDKNQAIVILYHEIMWDILDEMVNENILNMPIVFEKAKKAKKGDLRDLIFIIEQ